MGTYYDNNGDEIKTTSSIGGCGEAFIYNIKGVRTECAKIYKKSTQEHYKKLKFMISNPPEDPMLSRGHRSIAWPLKLLFLDKNKTKFAGFTMTKLNTKSFKSILQYSDPDFRRKNFDGMFNWYYLFNIARNITSAIAALHDKGYCIGDIRDVNILAAENTLITLIDCDSFQVKDKSSGKVYRCPVGFGDYTPPELQGKYMPDVDREIESDAFGLAVLIFMLLMEGYHPFGARWLAPGSAEEELPEGKIKKGYFPYGRNLKKLAPPKKAPKFEMLHPDIQKLFLICFVDGHTNPKKRPTAHEWWKVLGKLQNNIKECAENKKNKDHRYFDHLNKCPWCEMLDDLGIDSFSSSVGLQTKIKAKFKAKTPSKPVRKPSIIPSYITYGAEDIIIMSEKIAMLVGIVFGALLSLLPISLSKDWTTFAYGILLISSLGFGLTNTYRAKYQPNIKESIKKGAVAGFSIAILVFFLAIIAFKFFREESSRAVLNTLLFFPFLYITTLTAEILRGSLGRALSGTTKKISPIALATRPLIPVAFVIVIMSVIAIRESAINMRLSFPILKTKKSTPISKNLPIPPSTGVIDNISKEKQRELSYSYVEPEPQLTGEKSTLEVFSKPYEITLNINSKSDEEEIAICTTPCQIELQPGEYTLKAIKPGYKRVVKDVTIKQNRATRIDIEIHRYEKDKDDVFITIPRPKEY